MAISHHSVGDNYIDLDLSAMENEDDDDDDSIISQLENSLLPLDEMEGDCTESPNNLAYGNLVGFRGKAECFEIYLRK